MKKSVLLLSLLVLVTAGVVLADSAEWTGEVLDLHCYPNGQKGPDHASCAVRCLNGDSPMGLLIDGDVVYIDLEASDEAAITTLKNLGGKNATVTGEATQEDDKTTVKVTSAKASD